MNAIVGDSDRPKGRLLVVDDDLVQRTIIGKIGARLGYDAVFAPTFERAAELLRTQAFDIMTLDLSLGEHDGVELLRLAADLKLNAIPIVVISGCEERILNTTRRLGRALDLSLTSCLTKPLNLDHLREALLLPASGRVASASDVAGPMIDRERIVAGLEQNEFFVEFQPKVNLETGQVFGAEALARWRMPEFGILSPSIFIPIVERLGLMPDLTNRILTLAIADSRKLIKQQPGFTIAVNVSGSLLTDLMLPERIDGILRENGVAAESLIVEVTESVAMSDVDRATDILVRLRIKGVGAAIDDFGTGFSSLAALARLPFSELKIDQSFVKGCETDDDMMKIVEASVGLARAFHMKVVAEGIDNPRALAKMRQAGCDLGQGYLFAPSLRFDRFARWMSERQSQRATDAFPTFEKPKQPPPQAARR
jgi:EAL domain-containing protein (putative c-di-GMP-specific phosphodiesterase class I)/CheY-like chemotaxis protein